jgi:hypothetical protein
MRCGFMASGISRGRHTSRLWNKFPAKWSTQTKCRVQERRENERILMYETHMIGPKGIRVNAVAPGPIWTPRFRYPVVRRWKSWRNLAPRHRSGDPASRRNSPQSMSSLPLPAPAMRPVRCIVRGVGRIGATVAAKKFAAHGSPIVRKGRALTSAVERRIAARTDDNALHGNLRLVAQL